MDRFETLIEALEAHMKQDPTVECCGIITKDFSYIPCKNLSPVPKESFVLDPVALLKHSEDCWGIFHSHTVHHDDLPSEQDKDSAIYSQYKFVVGNLNKKFYQYWLNSLNYLEFKEFNKDAIEC
jgi:proteasome lid subunit RPN8/RPN11